MIDDINNQQTIRTMVYDLLNKYVEIVKEYYRENLLSVGVFGSFIRGTARFPESDIDILIIISDTLSLEDKIVLSRDIKKELSMTEDYKKLKDGFGGISPQIQEVIFTEDKLRSHPDILIDLTTNLKIIHDNGILAEEIDMVRRKLKRLGSKKVETKNSWFWILKPDLKPGEAIEI
jgi:predicted nucleotidyltransferase